MLRLVGVRGRVRQRVQLRSGTAFALCPSTVFAAKGTAFALCPSTVFAAKGAAFALCASTVFAAKAPPLPCGPPGSGSEASSITSSVVVPPEPAGPPPRCNMLHEESPGKAPSFDCASLPFTALLPTFHCLSPRFRCRWRPMVMARMLRRRRRRRRSDSSNRTSGSHRSCKRPTHPHMQHCSWILHWCFLNDRIGFGGSGRTRRGARPAWCGRPPNGSQPTAASLSIGCWTGRRESRNSAVLSLPFAAGPRRRALPLPFMAVPSTVPTALCISVATLPPIVFHRHSSPRMLQLIEDPQ